MKKLEIITVDVLKKMHVGLYSRTGFIDWFNEHIGELSVSNLNLVKGDVHDYIETLKYVVDDYNLASFNSKGQLITDMTGTTYSYDDIGSLIEMDCLGIITTFTYVDNQITSISDTNTLKITYMDGLLKTCEDLDSGEIFTYTHSEIGQVTKITSSTQGIYTEITYDDDSYTITDQDKEPLRYTHETIDGEFRQYENDILIVSIPLN